MHICMPGALFREDRTAVSRPVDGYELDGFVESPEPVRTGAVEHTVRYVTVEEEAS
jgi:hypothetical protein